MLVKMQAEIARRFRDGELTPASSIQTLKHIGPYLADRLRRTFNPNARRLTIRVFARRITPLTIQQLRSKLQRALQNERTNECVQSLTYGRYHVKDVNEMGWKACRALVHTLARGRDGHGLGAGFVFDYRQLRNPPARGHEAKYVGCIKSKEDCVRANGVWSDGLCMPRTDQRGFEGVSPYSGQRRRLGQRVRGQYAVSPAGKRWRRPGALHRLPM